MPAMPFSSTLRNRPAGTMAALGLLSGVLSAGWGQTYDLEALQPLAIVFLLAPGALPIGFFLRRGPGRRHGGVGAQAVGRASSSSSRRCTPGAPRFTRPSGCSAIRARTRTSWPPACVPVRSAPG